MKKFFLISLISLFFVSCGEGRNFKGSPFEGDVFTADEDFKPSYFYSFIKTQYGFTTKLSLEKKDEYGFITSTTLKILVNTQVNKVFIDNESAGDIECETSEIAEIDTCKVIWFDETFSSNLKILKTYKVNFSVSKAISYKNINDKIFNPFHTCDESYGDEIKGERISLFLKKDENPDIIALSHYDFGNEFSTRIPVGDDSESASTITHDKIVSAKFDKDFNGMPYRSQSVLSRLNPDLSVDFGNIVVSNLAEDKFIGLCFNVF